MKNEGTGTQKKKIRVLTENAYLLQKIRLELSEYAEIISENAKPYTDVFTIIDTDTVNQKGFESCFTLGHDKNCDMPLPFLLGDLRKKLFEKDDFTGITLIDSEKAVMLFGEKIKLTDVEYSLLSVLAEKKGGYTSREELLQRVWNNCRDGGVINVYIHYLREKLEKRGDKIIISSRKNGYKIDEKFFGGNEDA